MTRLESNNVSKASFLTVIDKLLKAEDIFKTVDNKPIKIGSKHKLYLGNFYIEFQPYNKKNEDRISYSIGYTTINDRFAISKHNKENTDSIQ